MPSKTFWICFFILSGTFHLALARDWYLNKKAKKSLDEFNAEQDREQRKVWDEQNKRAAQKQAAWEELRNACEAKATHNDVDYCRHCEPKKFARQKVARDAGF